MAKLIYTTMTSLDGCVADVDGKFDWTAPDEEVHAFINDHERTIGTYLYGRKLYDVMVAWETVDTTDQPAVIADYSRIWRAANKIVYSSTVSSPRSERTRIERVFDPETVRRLKAELDRDISVGGPHLAASAIAAGLVDECHVFVAPIAVGGGNRALPDGVRWELELVDQYRFRGGVVHLHYRTR